MNFHKEDIKDKFNCTECPLCEFQTKKVQKGVDYKLSPNM